MNKQQHSARSTDRDDADARGEHLYPDAQQRRSQPGPTVERDPDHYAAGADGTQQVVATPPSAEDEDAHTDHDSISSARTLSSPPQRHKA